MTKGWRGRLWFGALVALAQGLSLVCNTHVWSLISTSRGFISLFWNPRIHVLLCHMDTQTCTQIWKWWSVTIQYVLYFPSICFLFRVFVTETEMKLGHIGSHLPQITDYGCTLSHHYYQNNSNHSHISVSTYHSYYLRNQTSLWHMSLIFFLW